MMDLVDFATTVRFVPESGARPTQSPSSWGTSSIKEISVALTNCASLMPPGGVNWATVVGCAMSVTSRTMTPPARRVTNARHLLAAPHGLPGLGTTVASTVDAGE